MVIYPYDKIPGDVQKTPDDNDIASTEKSVVYDRDNKIYQVGKINVIRNIHSVSHNNHIQIISNC